MEFTQYPLTFNLTPVVVKRADGTNSFKVKVAVKSMTNPTYNVEYVFEDKRFFVLFFSNSVKFSCETCRDPAYYGGLVFHEIDAYSSATTYEKARIYALEEDYERRFNMSCYGTMMFVQQEVDAMAIQNRIKAKRAKIDLYKSKLDFLYNCTVYPKMVNDNQIRNIEEFLMFSITKTTKVLNKFYAYYEYIEKTPGEVLDFHDFIADKELLNEATHRMIWNINAYREVERFGKVWFFNSNFVTITLPSPKWTPVKKFTK